MIVRIRAVGVLSSYTKGGNATAQVYIYLIKSQIGKVYKTSMISIQTIVLYFLPDFGGGVRLHDPNALRGNRGGAQRYPTSQLRLSLSNIGSWAASPNFITASRRATNAVVPNPSISSRLTPCRYWIVWFIALFQEVSQIWIRACQRAIILERRAIFLAS